MFYLPPVNTTLLKAIVGDYRHVPANKSSHMRNGRVEMKVTNGTDSRSNSIDHGN